MIFQDSQSLISWRGQFDSTHKRLVITNGVFDILHSGHVKFLKAAKELGDFLLVGINSDSSVKQLKGDSRPINNELARAEVLDSLKSVDGVYIFDSVRCNEFIDLARPNIYTKASDYSLETLNFEEKLSLEKSGAIIIFLNFIDGFSTTSIINKIKA